jgi:DMSO/TMAO reductase YedYZ heme-binding membrane subunit
MKRLRLILAIVLAAAAVVSASAVAAVLHYWWLVKPDVRRPEAYVLVVGCLLAARLWWAWARKPLVAARVAA